MNVKIVAQLREACAWARANGITIVQGPWFEWRGGKVVAADPIGALLVQTGQVTQAPEDHSKPGYVKLACQTLKVDGGWLRRFWMGFDRGYKVTLVVKKDKKEVEARDDVSAFGIALWRELTTGELAQVEEDPPELEEQQDCFAGTA